MTKDINIKELSVADLVKSINEAGYSNVGIERIFELEFGLLDKWISGEEDVTCVGLALLRMVSNFPFLLKVAEHNFKKEKCRQSFLDEMIKNK